MIISHGLLLPLLVSLHGTAAQDRCTTPGNDVGICINIYNCQPVIQIFQYIKPLPREVLNYIERLHCGFEGKNLKVCCRQQVTTASTTTATTPSTTLSIDPPDVSNHPNLRLINSDICGPASEQKIFSGNKTDVFDFPWMALLLYRYPGGTEMSPECVGTLINKRYVLTAASCLSSLGSKKLISVRVGEHDLSTERDCIRDMNGAEIICAERYQDHDIESTLSHPEYSVREKQNDIALVRLNRDVDFSAKNVKPICLPVGSAVTPLTPKFTATAWYPRDWTEEELGDKLLQVQLTPVSTEECAKAYKNKKQQIQIWYKHLCATYEGGVYYCNGNGGGPLQARTLYNNMNVKFIQYGIVSFGPLMCGFIGPPEVYTRVVYYMDWILDSLRP